MNTVPYLARSRTQLNGTELVQVERLVATWRWLADLSFSDLLLLAPFKGEEGHRFVVLAQVRPVTGQTNYPQDLVGVVIDEVERPLLTRCWRTVETVEGDTTAVGSKDRVHVTCIPMLHRDKPIAVMTQESPVSFTRREGDLERAYLEAFDRFAAMLAEGSFPFEVDEMEVESAPRVGDGVILIDADARVRFASPNAVSSLHRMGIHTYAQGQLLADIGFDDAAARAAMATQLPVAEEHERDEVFVVTQIVPQLQHGQAIGALMLLRDVSDVRRRDRLLLSKDATIREIHHRVKNNLQTIASLLRLQTRRLRTPEARAALAESERRIRSIAIVHETLSREPGDIVHFSEIVRPLARLVEDTASSPDLRIRFRVEGDAGDLPGETATSLAVVLNELMQNAVDHAFPEGATAAQVSVQLRREGEEVALEVVDNGVGLPESFSLERGQGLGLTIVHALVTGELDGTIEMRSNGGTSVCVRVPVQRARSTS